MKVIIFYYEFDPWVFNPWKLFKEGILLDETESAFKVKVKAGEYWYDKTWFKYEKVKEYESNSD